MAAILRGTAVVSPAQGFSITSRLNSQILAGVYGRSSADNHSHISCTGIFNNQQTGLSDSCKGFLPRLSTEPRPYTLFGIGSVATEAYTVEKISKIPPRHFMLRFLVNRCITCALKDLLRKKFLLSLPLHSSLLVIVPSTATNGAIVYRCHYQSSSFDPRSHDFDFLDQATTMPLTTPSLELSRALNAL
ncbi:hypothetical protein LR48_Vigan02g101800 [Vigna angularis]|uniref:Uncharacterized protein n=1 Tax=Phaseolus angularis TaxID=3914 RepID=A0A0L9TWA0_PHAAN|nr:hypothetical protein LR48_Vigan02g101800 [Vigna angularis]